MKETHNSDYLIEREPIEGTPFTLVTHEEMSFITWGAYRLTENRPTKEMALELLTTNMWDVIAVYVISVVAQTSEINAAKKAAEENN